MHLISIRYLRNDAAIYPDVAEQIEVWYRVVRDASWQSLQDVKEIYPSTDAVGNFTVFNIKGNAYRLIVDIDYETQTIYYKYFLSHGEYDKERWKKNPYF
ncbi:toxin RelE [Dulcicalothrix desertica PCC 7102]|uniref:Toxin RelE n=1 Tax=Dulcicalothrix desertica PCC 7102 TaxID=232991 RepID=A0A433VNS2_9CYAN|nr:type II toxin-antitoxin system HigB family toxin [Dulcicalothrix desertica]RUT07737.1 toxin RelE [Dulcicalothrix desertica PCC 7102]TWH39271.1 mRNA interferase HigB [Dulcicalothrix desertica PCC 7102]